MQAYEQTDATNFDGMLLGVTTAESLRCQLDRGEGILFIGKQEFNFRTAVFAHRRDATGTDFLVVQDCYGAPEHRYQLNRITRGHWPDFIAMRLKYNQVGHTTTEGEPFRMPWMDFQTSRRV
jgi:hypothetical protein